MTLEIGFPEPSIAMLRATVEPKLGMFRLTPMNSGYSMQIRAALRDMVIWKRSHPHDTP